MKEELGPLKTIMATGGLASLLAGDSEHIDGVDNELTLKGLKIIYDRNQGTGRSRRR
jgi:type III pantothenate kinase